MHSEWVRVGEMFWQCVFQFPGYDVEKVLGKEVGPLAVYVRVVTRKPALWIGLEEICLWGRRGEKWYQSSGFSRLRGLSQISPPPPFPPEGLTDSLGLQEDKVLFVLKIRDPVDPELTAQGQTGGMQSVKAATRFINWNFGL